MAQNPNQQRAADAVAAWLAKNGKNNAWLVDATGADPGTIGDFLNHERWPKIGTQGKIENALGWPAGIIRQIGNGADVPDELITERAPAPAAGSAPPSVLAAELETLRQDVEDLRRRVRRLEEQRGGRGSATVSRLDQEKAVRRDAERRAAKLVDLLERIPAMNSEELADFVEAVDSTLGAVENTSIAARTGTPALRGPRRLQDEAAEAPDPEGPEGGA